MRTNPFFDAWLFIIGSTDDHQKLGAAKFLLLALFLELVAVRLFALLAVGFSLHLWLGLYAHPAEWPWNYVFLAVVLALFVNYAAGRSLGADALLRRRAAKSSSIGRFVDLAG